MDLKQAKELISSDAKDIIDICPHCGAKAHIEEQWNDYHHLNWWDIEFYVIFRCKPCQKLLLKTFYFEQNPYSNSTLLTAKGWREKFPITLDHELNIQDYENIPKQVLEDYIEALKCKSIGANKASCAMFRRALQSSLIDLWADSKLDLIVQINSLDSLSADIKDWAHQIRILGNRWSHPDEDNLKNIDSDDVIEVHDFMSKFLTFMFIMPKKVALSRAKREEKTNEKAKKTTK